LLLLVLDLHWLLIGRIETVGVLCVWTNHQLASTGVGVGVSEVVQPEVDHVVAVVLASDHQVPRGLGVLAVHPGNRVPEVPGAGGEIVGALLNDRGCGNCDSSGFWWYWC